jgi:D-alanyl-D-alanine carboxypeptidase
MSINRQRYPPTGAPLALATAILALVATLTIPAARATVPAPAGAVVPASAGAVVLGAAGAVVPGAAGAVVPGAAGAVVPGAAAAVAPVPAAVGGAAGVAAKWPAGQGAAAGWGAGAQPAGPAVGPPRVLAKVALLADEATGQVLFERGARQPRAMASTTKVMTALLALERLDERRVVRIGVGPPRVGEESLRLRQGERLTVRQLLLGLLVKSANDAALALAEAVDGSEAAFVRRMNRRAAALRLTSTRYVTPYGLDRPGHQTSARDLARLWEVAMRRADFRALVATRAARLPGVPLSLRRFIASNQLLGSYRWVVGGKTGFTNRAGRCLVASASRGGRRLVAVALGSPNAFADVRALFEHGFSKFVRVRLAARGQPVTGGAGRPPALQVDADVDALVGLDQLNRVHLSLAGNGSGSAGAGSGSPSSGWFMVGERRLVQVPLARILAGGPPPSATLLPPSSAGTPGTTGTLGTTGTSGTPGGRASGSGGVVLIAGAAVRVGPVPAGASAPVVDPFLRRDPP